MYVPNFKIFIMMVIIKDDYGRIDLVDFSSNTRLLLCEAKKETSKVSTHATRHLLGSNYHVNIHTVILN